MHRSLDQPCSRARDRAPRSAPGEETAHSAPRRASTVAPLLHRTSPPPGRAPPAAGPGDRSVASSAANDGGTRSCRVQEAVVHQSARHRDRWTPRPSCVAKRIRYHVLISSASSELRTPGARTASSRRCSACPSSWSCVPIFDDPAAFRAPRSVQPRTHRSTAVRDARTRVRFRISVGQGPPAPAAPIRRRAPRSPRPGSESASSSAARGQWRCAGAARPTASDRARRSGSDSQAAAPG